jgi:galactokinase
MGMICNTAVEKKMENRIDLNLYDAFHAVFGPGTVPVACFAPGRVNLIGEHTDYNGGHVLPCALTMGITVLARTNNLGYVRLYSVNYQDSGMQTFPIHGTTYAQARGWANYPAGVIAMLEHRNLTLPCGVDFLMQGDLPVGAGLSSSAALEVAVAYALHMLFFPQLTCFEIAQIGQETENHFIGVQSGIMDPFASAMCRPDHALFLRTSDLEYTHVPCNFGNYALIIANTNKHHQLVSSAYNQRRKECEQALQILRTLTNVKTLCALSPDDLKRFAHALPNETLFRRARHAVTENARTIEAANALAAGDLVSFGQLMNASHISLRDDFNVSCPELDVLVQAAWDQPNVLGSRMTGGGFGGCTVNLVEESTVQQFIHEVGHIYTERTGRTADFYRTALGGGVHSLL